MKLYRSICVHCGARVCQAYATLQGKSGFRNMVCANCFNRVM